MLHLLWLIPFFPLLGFTALVVLHERLPHRAVACIGCGSVAIAAVITIAVAIAFGVSDLPGNAFEQTLWTWMHIGNFSPAVTFHLDALSTVMMLVITCVGFLIHLYSAEFMQEDPSYTRYFAYMNLFVASMLVLVLANNLVLLFVGWEGVGLCSYLLIGFWQHETGNCIAARKAFVVTRVGDAAMAVGLFLIFAQLGTLNIHELMQRASDQWVAGSALANAAALLLLAGAVGKSAQLPLQTWLPDAMAGPTPVSALIHAATMVTAGVYLIDRTHVLFTLAPPVQLAVAIIGALTLLLSGFSALTQRDIKRVLAYSTISQIGYMFLALGVGAWSAAIFHLVTHACFKALLFLASGVVIMALDEEHDIYKMGGLRTRLPLAFWSYLIGSAALAALPLITAGFYSKDMILSSTWASPLGGFWLWAGGLVGALLTGIYIFRTVFVAFFGEPKTEVGAGPGIRISIALVALSIAAVGIGFIETPSIIFHITVLSDFLHTALPESAASELGIHTELLLELLASGASLLGIFVAYRMFMRRRPEVSKLASDHDARLLSAFWDSGWGFDWLYEHVLLMPYHWVARVNRFDVVDVLYNTIALITRTAHFSLSDTQTGRVRWYAGVLASGAVIVIALAVLS